MVSLKKTKEAFDILSKYEGDNPYILSLKKSVYILGDTDAVKDFQVEYILRNHNFTPKVINKNIKLADWYSKKKKEEWNLDFEPKIFKVCTLIGETNAHYHCYIQYRKSVEPIKCFLPKRAMLGNLFVEDYHKVEVDFDRYDRLASRVNPERKLKKHQKEAVQFLLSRKKCILADDMGLGKTNSLAIASIEGNFDAILIICPASLKDNWKKELMYYVPERDISIIDGFTGKNKKELEKYLGYGEGKSGKKVDELLEEAKSVGKWKENRYVIVNFDILDEFYQIPKSWSKKNIDEAFENSPMLKYINNRKSLIIIDEAHRLSNTTSGQYKTIKDIIKRGNPDSIYLATGTPITNNPLNLFNLLQFLGDPITDEREYYLERYCDAKKIPAKGEWQRLLNVWCKSKKKSGWDSLSQYEKKTCREFIMSHAKTITTSDGATNLDELKERISHIYLRRLKEDLTDLDVDKTVHEMFYDLTPTQKSEYDRLWDEYEQAQLNENPDKELNKELLEGSIYRRYLSNEMVPNTIHICDKLLERGEKVVIMCCYDEELYSLQEHYKNNCVIYNGKMSLKQKEKAISDFQDNPECMVFIGNIIAAGVGITLTSARYMIFNNISYVPGDDRQAEDRIYRIGQTRDCHIIYQLFRDTQYEIMWNLVLKKSLVINQVIKKEGEK